jgi:NAD(P)-dependent dehydrogenase (short-subunit alcohol dehydrogenase family)
MAEERMRELARESGRAYAQVRAEEIARVPLQRIGEPDEIAGTVAFLLSPDASGFTGQALDPNDGAWMG